MQTDRLKWGVGFVLGCCVLLGALAAAEAVIKIDIAEVQDGKAYIEGKGAVLGAQIFWEEALVTTANTKNGGFEFFGVLPAECRGELSDGADTVFIDVLGCTPAAAGAPAPVERTGQTMSVAAGDDGALEKGVPFPSPRFTDNDNGTVTDNLTELIWLKNASCFGGLIWANALTAANDLSSGSCGLTDGSVAGDWRLPNVKELQSLIHFGFVNPALSNAAGTAGCSSTDCAFSGAQSGTYWSSTSQPEAPQGVGWSVSLAFGGTFTSAKTNLQAVWPVRGGAE